MVARRALTGAILVLGLLSVASDPAQATRKLRLGFADGLFGSAEASERGLWLDRVGEAGGELIRVNVNWAATTLEPPADPRNPADPAYDFAALDAAIDDARARGLQVMLTLYRAPSWAEGADRPVSAPAGSWKPDPGAFGDFVHAVAERYRGQVSYYQAWNEPNLRSYLSPQYRGKRAVSPAVYRRLLNALYTEVHAVDGAT